MSTNPSLNGTTTFFPHAYTDVSVTVTLFCALTLYNACELLLLIVMTFQRYRGLYFWSLLIASSGLIPYAVGFILGYFELSVQLLSQILLAIGWPMMVTGQSMVLYSRLGIVLGESHRRILKAVKIMIIFNGTVFYISTEILVLGTFYAKDNTVFAEIYKYNEQVQMTAYSLQELILSGLYLWRALDLLKTLPFSGKRARIMRELVAINIIIVIMEVALLVMEYQNRHVIEQTLKGVVYSLKLKLEFAVLNKLIAMSSNGNHQTFWKLDNVELEVERGSSSVGLQASRLDSNARSSDGKSTAVHVDNTSHHCSELMDIEERCLRCP